MAIRVAVIGAGAGGLCALRQLTSRPNVFSAMAFEQSSQIGGTWVYTDDVKKDKQGLPVHSSMYRNLRTNIPKEVMAFPDYPFNASLPSFVRHQEVLNYLQDYAQHFNLFESIQLKTQVQMVEPIENSAKERKKPGNTDHKWEVTVAPVGKPDSPVKHEFDAIIVCNGHYAVPLLPKIPGLSTFKGEMLHSHEYRQPEQFANKTVLCLGAAASGQDICIDLSSQAKEVYLCHNKNLIQSPLPTNVHQKPGIKSINGSEVTLLDGQTLTADVLMLCTGYHFTFPFLSPVCSPKNDEERLTPLFKHMIHAEFPSLFFIGICKIICPFPQFHVQVKLMLAILDGSYQLPTREQMVKDIEKDYQARLSEGLPKRHAHQMGPRQWGYNDEMARLAGCEPIPSHVQKLYDYVHETRVKNLVDYKKVNYQLEDDKKFVPV